jgi:hypothetical protein
MFDEKNPKRIFFTRPTTQLLATEKDTFLGVEKVSDNQRRAIKWWLAYLQSSECKQLSEEWMIGYWLDQLTKKNIKHKFLDKSFCIYQHADGALRQSFHTTFEVQEEAAAILNKELLDIANS